MKFVTIGVIRVWGGSRWPRSPILATTHGVALLSDTIAMPRDPSLFGISVDFILFGLTLLGVAVFHRHTLRVALTGLVTISIYKVAFTGFKTGNGVTGFVAHVEHEWVILVNLLCLLTGFALLSRHFEKSQVPVVLPKFLPHDWKGCFMLLAIVWLLSSFLDNIAAALIGGAMAHQIFRGKVHIGFLAAIVAASNAGGSWSVVGDTTTTMMWIAGVSPMQVFHASIAATTALFVFGIPAAIKQHKYSPILGHAGEHPKVDWARIGIVGLILILALATNVTVNAKFPEHTDRFPFIGVAVWVVILMSAGIRRPDWEMLPRAFRSSIFLLALVLIASMMPVERLPLASWPTALGLGFLSAVFDNIPLTALALKQGGYDWGGLAYAVGFGGSMIWFGSSAGVAISTIFPEARSVGRWIKEGWFVAVAYVAGFIVMLMVIGWHPEPLRRPRHGPAETSNAQRRSFCIRRSMLDVSPEAELTVLIKYSVYKRDARTPAHRRAGSAHAESFRESE
jgi:Na+/H+ antiporter NhaD/arsenite permease-like protein